MWGQYGEASIDVHDLLDITVDAATRESWRFLGARSQAEARGYYMATLRRAWGVAAVREFARHRVSRLSRPGRLLSVQRIILSYLIILPMCRYRYHL